MVRAELSDEERKLLGHINTYKELLRHVRIAVHEREYNILRAPLKRDVRTSTAASQPDFARSVQLIRSPLVTVLASTTLAKRGKRSRTPERERCERREVFPSVSADGELYQKNGQLPDREAPYLLAELRAT